MDDCGMNPVSRRTLETQAACGHEQRMTEIDGVNMRVTCVICRKVLSGEIPAAAVNTNTSPTRGVRRVRLSDRVHYVLPDGVHGGEHRAAIVTSAWPHSPCNLAVFSDCVDGPDALVRFEETAGHPTYLVAVYRVTIVHQDEIEKRPGTWHFPESSLEEAAKYEDEVELPKRLET